MRTLKILSILSIAGILILSLFSWYSCDDFCNINELLRYSVFKMAWLQYLNWDGRSLSIAAFVQLLSLKYFSVEVTTLLWALSFVASAILVFKISRIENPFVFGGLNPIIGIAIMSAILWLGMWKLIPDIIYWATGGSYSMLNMLGMFWLWVFLRGLKEKHFNAVRRVLIFFIAFICGVNSHNFVTALMMLCIIELFQHWFIEKDKRASIYITCSLAGLLAGACIVFLSPGNQVRLHVISYQGLSSKFLYFYFIVLAKYIYWLSALVFLCLAVTWLSGTEFFKRRNFFSLKQHQENFVRKHLFFRMIYKHKYLIAALSTILVFTATSFFAVPRTGIFFATFLVIYFFQQAWNSEWNMNSKRFLYGSISFLGIFICVIAFQVFKAKSVKNLLTEREILFERSIGMDAVVKPVPGAAIPFAFTFTDISPDSNYWVNRCIAQHYGLKTVRTDKQ